MNPLEAFPGGADKARAFIESARLFVMGPTDGTETTMSKQMHAVFNLALLGLDSLAADPEREAKVEALLDEINEWGHMPPGFDAIARHDEIEKSARALLRPAPPSPSAVADKIVRDVAELPDRDSPEDWPEAMLVTGDELRAIVLAALAASNANARGGE